MVEQPTSRRTRAVSLLRSHRGLLVILALQAVVVVTLLGRASPWATLSLDCVAGTVAETALFEPGWGPGEVVDGLVWSQALSGLVALPGYAALGTGYGLVGKAAAFLWAMGLVVLVYLLGLRASGRPGGLFAAAVVAFSPPMVFHTSLVLGNWHWTGLVFDYGVLLLALRIGWPQDRGAESRWQRWPGFAALGLGCGLAVLNSPKSLPFVAVACVVAFSGARPRRWLAGLPATAAGAAVGGLPLLLHRVVAGGPEEATGDAIWSRLFAFRPDLAKLGDLFGEPIAKTLHLEGPLGWQAGEALSSAWVACCWIGCLLALGGVVWGLARREGADGGSVMARLGPLAFCALFALAYLVLDTRLRVLPPDFGNYRQNSHRAFTAMLMAMAVGGAGGWGWLWSRCRGMERPLTRRALRGIALLGAATPAVICLVAQLSLAAGAPGLGRVGLDTYRGHCFDVSGFFAAGKEPDPEAMERFCGRLSSPDRRRDCLAGAAWGIGHLHARLEPAPPYPTDRPVPSGDLCDHVPPTERGRCAYWEPGQQPGMGGELAQACDALPGTRRDLCYMGGGWYHSQVAWGTEDWPLEACESLVDERARAACWTGPGFHMIDHLAVTPPRLRSALARVPDRRRPDVARGAGVMLGRTWASGEVAGWVCDQMEEERLVAACRDGVALAREHAYGE